VELGILLFVVYFFPSFIGWRRRHHNAGAIFVLNLLLGWTVLGWAAALVWASTRTEAPILCPAPATSPGGDGPRTCKRCQGRGSYLDTSCPFCGAPT
jgi:hypothetical protein